jgi:hypothetical protein
MGDVSQSDVLSKYDLCSAARRHRQRLLTDDPSLQQLAVAHRVPHHVQAWRFDSFR